MYRHNSKFWTYVLSSTGAVVSLVALYEHVIYRYGLAKGPSFCNISQHINCEAVNASEWSVFLGVPIASYGIFFYIAVLGLLWVSGPGRRVSDEQSNQVVFVGTLFGSLISLALFAISELIIGALCLLCVGLYLITFALFTVTWRSSGASFLSTLSGGVRGALSFLCGICRGHKPALIGAVSLVLWGVVAVASPAITYDVALAMRGSKAARGPQTLAQTDPVRAWREAPLQQIPVSFGVGAFGDYAKGDSQAPIQIVEFADFECPGCRVLYTALQPVLERFKGHYHFVFKNFPLDSACNPGISGKFHQNSCFAAYFIRCAGEQGRFWEALDYAFTDPVLERDGAQSDEQVEEVRKTMIGDGAAALGLDAQALSECITSGRYLARVQEEVQQGASAGLTSTPSIWINGKRVEYPAPEAIEKIFSAVVAERGIVVAETGGSK
jgi:uncharacterized membrane protein/protein-disulfide isomerase